jgi:hypothetical protein
MSKMDTDQQTLKTKQTSGEQIDPRWQKVLQDLQIMIPKHTFDTFLIGSSLVGIEDGLATIGTT